MSKVPHLRLNLSLGQWIDLDGKLYRLVRRARDDERQLVFEAPDGLSVNMTDKELLDLQHSPERQLRLLSDAQARDRQDSDRPITSRLLIASDEEDQAVALLKKEYVDGWKRAGRPPRTVAGMQQCVTQTALELRARRLREDGKAFDPGELDETALRAPHPRTVINWIAKWFEHGETVEAFLPQDVDKGNRERKLDPQVAEILDKVVEETYFDETRPTAAATWQSVKTAVERHNAPLPLADRLTMPGRGAVYIHIKRTDPYTRDFCRLGKRQADLNWRSTGSAPDAGRHNEVWEMDDTLVDAIVLDDETGTPIGRPTVTDCIDRHTRAVPGLPYISFDPPGIFSTFEYLRSAILPKDRILAELGFKPEDYPYRGKPRFIVPDRGTNFRSKSFALGLGGLGIDIDWNPKLSPWYKARKERYYRTAHAVFHRVPGTTFSDFFERNKEKPPETVATVTLGELRRLADHWVVGIYNRRPHRGLLRRSPLQAFNESVARFGLDPLPNPDDVRNCLSPIEFRCIHHYGVEYETLVYNTSPGGGSLGLMELRLRHPRSTKFRLVIDPLDITGIGVVDPETGEVIQAQIKESLRTLVTGVTLEKHKLAVAIRRTNSDVLEGEEGLRQAYAIFDDKLRAFGAGKGLANRRKAAAVLEKLRRAKARLQAPALVDEDASSRSIIDDIFEEPGGRTGAGPGADIPSTTAITATSEDGALPVPTEAVPAAAAKGAVKPRRPAADPAPTPAARSAPAIPAIAEPVPDDDFEDFARAMAAGATRMGDKDR